MMLKHRVTGLSKDMISPPSPQCPDISDLHSDIIPPLLAASLEYLSGKLHAKSIHLSLIVVKAYTTFGEPKHDVRLISTEPLSSRNLQRLGDIASKAQKKFPLVGHGWFRAIANPSTQENGTPYLIQRSLIQHEVLFSTEALILLNVDHIYTLKHRLQDDPDLPPHFAREARLTSLRRVVELYGNRPLSAGYLRRAYDHLTVSDQRLQEIDEVYRGRYGSAGIIFAGALSITPSFPPAGFGSHAPITPNTATDVSPATQTEWKFYVNGLP